MRYIFSLIIFILMALPIFAQETEAEIVRIPASDGLEIVADFYHADSESAPAILLIHMLNSRRSAYDPLIPALQEAGYHVLNMDMRGHGETGGRQDWVLAVEDVQVVLRWLAEQAGVDGVAVIGASIGSNIALMGCAMYADCTTVVALSPGLDYRGVRPAETFIENIGERPALLVASRMDRESADAVLALLSDSNSEVTVRMYRGRAHGTELFASEAESIIPALVQWMDEQFFDA